VQLSLLTTLATSVAYSKARINLVASVNMILDVEKPSCDFGESVHSTIFSSFHDDRLRW
jgi:hypothetical protein